MSDFDSLTWAFESWFDKPLRDLPDALRQRVEQEFSVPWGALSADQRRSLALQLDYQHDPAAKQDQRFWRDFFVQKDDLENQITQWEAVATPTATDLALKEAQLKELRQKLAGMEQQERQTRGDYYPHRPRLDGEDGAPSAMPDSPVRYVA